jgi:23S rRNA (guanosine2251-2'-O)-methyltransferase
LKNTVYTGYHSIEELLKQKNQKGVLYFSKLSARNSKAIEQAKRQGCQTAKVSETELSKIVEGASHRGIAFVDSSVNRKNDKKSVGSSNTKIDFDSYLKSLESSDALVIILDGITDPHNLGAIVRSADQFQVDMVLLPSRNSAKDNSTVSKTSAGAVNYVNINVLANISRAMEQLKKYGFWIYGADMDGSCISKTNLTGRVVLVMGSEGKGLRELTRSKCDNLISIPTKGNVDSLNVSVAAGIMMYEVRRQQNFS